MATRLCIVPKELANAKEATNFLRLPHPRTGYANLFLPYDPVDPPLPLIDTPAPSPASSFVGQDGLLEVQAIAPPDDQKRSWFIDEQVVSDGRLMIMTPFDPIFLLAAILLAVQRKNSRLLQYSDIFEEASTAYSYTRVDLEGKGKGKADDVEDDLNAGGDALVFGALPCVRRAAEQICDVTEIADNLHTYKLSVPKLLAILRMKVFRLAKAENFTEAKFPTLSRLIAREGLGDGEGIGPEVMHEAREKAALDVIVNYLPTEIELELKKTYSFETLQSYLDRISGASSLSSDHISGLATPVSDSGFTKTKGKPVLGANGKKKKAPNKNSKGVEALKKVSKQGMKPLTTFFKKSPSPQPPSSAGESSAS